MQNFSLSVVLPAYNEENNIKDTVLSCLSCLGSRFEKFEIIVVNDGSQDGTEEITRDLSHNNPRIKLVTHTVNLGYGSALRSGFDNASHDYIFLMDSDGQFNINEIDLLLESANESTVVIGYRKNRADPIIRKLNQKLYHLYIRLMFGLQVRDIDCAFKLFPGKIYRSVNPIISSGAFFSAEFLIKIKNRGFAIKEVPVTHYPRKFGKQTGADLGVIFRMFRESWNFSDEHVD